jgi:hypothetical protein
MKLVKEHINEKFTEDSDPIEDLGIGLPAIWNNLKRGDVLQLKQYMEIFPDVGSYILITGVDEKPENQYPKRIHYIHFHTKKRLIEALKELKKYPSDHSYGWGFSYEFFKDYWRYVPKNELMESMNQKFTEYLD